MRNDDFDRGLKNRRAVLGDDWVERATGSANSFDASFQELITRYAWHEIWGRPGLDPSTRRLLVLGMTMGLARWEEFELHFRAALRAGVPLESLQETLMQGAIYCGVPAANTAFKIARELLRSEGRAPEPAPLTPVARAQRYHTFRAPQMHVALQGVGAGTPIVLSHALGLDLSMWDGLVARLSDRHPLLRYDHRGHGGSACPAGPYTLDELVDDAARIVREWGRGPVVFIGLSMGGMVGQGLAIRHPELLRGLVLANTTARYPAVAKAAWSERIEAVAAGGMAAVADMVVERYLSSDFRAARPGFTQALRAQILRCDPVGYGACCQAVRDVDWLDRLPEVRCATLVIAGGRDVGATPAMARDIAERIPGAQLHVIDNASHLSVAEYSDQFAAAVQCLLQGI